MLLLNLLERLAARKRSAGKRGIWSAIAFGSFAYRLYLRRARSQVAVLREPLRPGESLLITHTTQRRG
jgi:hypothetical protein